MTRVLAPLVVAMFITGCGSSTFSQGPSDTLRAYSRAIQDKRVEDAYRLLSKDAKRSVSLEAFRRMILESPEDASELARSLARPSSDPVVTAKVITPQGDELVLIYENNRWRIDGTSLDFYSQATPKQAIVGFLRAFERKRYDVLVRYVPDSKKAADANSPELDEARLRESFEGPQKEDFLHLTQALKAALGTSNIEETNDRASMQYGANGTLQLVREHGIWKIEFFQLFSFVGDVGLFGVVGNDVASRGRNTIHLGVTIALGRIGLGALVSFVTSPGTLDLGLHLARRDLSPHHEVGTKRPRWVFERRRAIFLDAEVPYPRGAITSQWREQQQRGSSQQHRGSNDAHRSRCADEMKRAIDRMRVFSHVKGPELFERLVLVTHGVAPD